MSDIVIVALVSLGGTLVGTFSGIVVSSRLTAYRLEQLEKKVDKHNKLVEWRAEAEQRIRYCEQALEKD